MGKFTNNDETFTNFDSKQWAAPVKELDEVMTEWEKAVETSDDEKLAKWLPRSRTLERITPHIGQMIYVRKEQGSWNPENGVKE